MNKIKELQTTLQDKTLIVSDKIAIYYLTGYRFDVGERMLALVLKKDTKPTLFLNKLFASPSDINTIVFEDSDDVSEMLSNFLPDGDIYVDGTFPARFLIPLLSGTRSFFNGSHYIENMRRIKSDEEIEILKEASKHNDRIMTELESELIEGMTELELADIVVKKQSTLPLSGISFEPITVFSENIADPHGIPSNRKLRRGDAVLIDMGGMYKGYASDMTRTFFFGKNEKLEELYNIVLEANLKAIDAVKVGDPISNVDKAARDVITSYGYGEYFIHRTGHGIGLETHENLDVSSTNDTPMEAGMVFSIEPGIYIEGIGGIRIEDLVVVTNEGAEVINNHSKELKYID